MINKSSNRIVGWATATIAAVTAAAVLAAAPAIAAHGSSSSTAGIVASTLGSPDPRDAGTQGGNPIYLSYAHAPDTNDSLQFARTEPTLAAPSRAFAWDDFGIGAGVAAGSILVLLSLGAATRRIRASDDRLSRA